MKRIVWSAIRWILPAILGLSTAGSAPAVEADSVHSVSVQSWLVLGPLSVDLPLFHDQKDVLGETYGLKQLLEFDHADVYRWRPIEGESMAWRSEELIWNRIEADSAGLTLYSGSSDQNEIFYAAVYIDASRFTEVTLRITGYHLFRVFLDGEMILQKTKSDEPGEHTTPKTKTVTLEPGKHLCIVKTLRDRESAASWTVNAEMKLTEETGSDDPVFTTIPSERMTVEHMIYGTKISDISISPDGKRAAVSCRRRERSDARSESWIELRKVKDGTLERSYRGLSDLSRIQWAPSGNRFSYTRSVNEKRTLWIVDLDTGSHRPLLEDVEHLGRHTWAQDGSFIVYSVAQRPKTGESGLKRLRGMPDRWPDWRERSALYTVSVASGVRRKLTAGGISTDLGGIHPDGRSVIFSRSFVDYSERPYSKTTYHLLDLVSMETDSLFTTAWSGSASWSPDGSQICFTGGPEMFGDLGVHVAEGNVPNGYDTQAYIYTVATGAVDPITKPFNPSVNSIHWSRFDGQLYLTATDETFQRLYRYDLKKRSFNEIEIPVDVIGRFDMAYDVPYAVFTGSGMSLPARGYAVDLRKSSVRVLADPELEQYRHVQFGGQDDWDFQSSQGHRIAGRIYLPPDFDAEKTYPCIVYYYGGTSPVTRDFGGRYPKEIWAANGYIVYVLQPSGATGFGQDFSALHVNDWGIIVAEEIIEGVRKFLQAHPFVDPERVGCIGASYGGFMTMLLTTRTDLFSAAVAHAGISSISSYWGEGFWGYLYSATATANSFPWNRKDIYVDQSPLFAADRVSTPILLTHGNVDTNVPPGESIQFYTALKLLGKETELILIDGQNHHILETKKRVAWTKSIIAWFDRWLKDQPEWWNHLYPEE